MSLMAIRLAPRFSSSLAMIDVIGQVVLGPLRVEDVAGVADGGLAEHAASRGRPRARPPCSGPS